MKKTFAFFLILSLLLSVPALADEDDDAESGAVDIGGLQIVPDEIRSMTDDELAEAIRSKAADYGLSLTDGQVKQISSVCRELSELDGEALEEKIEEIKDTVEEVKDTVEEVKEKKDAIAGFFAKVSAFFSKVADFFKKAADAIMGLF